LVSPSLNLLGDSIPVVAILLSITTECE